MGALHLASMEHRRRVCQTPARKGLKRAPVREIVGYSPKGPNRCALGRKRAPNWRRRTAASRDEASGSVWMRDDADRLVPRDGEADDDRDIDREEQEHECEHDETCATGVVADEGKLDQACC